MLAACTAPGVESDPEDSEYFEGTAFDEGRTVAPPDFGKADVLPPYEVPADLPDLVRPEVIISLKKRTVHLFDRATEFSRVYPTGVGVIGRSGRSITPTGHFATGPDPSDTWWYMKSRQEPAYFEGYPFLRLTTENSRGWNTYGLHGPITNPLRRGYVSKGCMRMNYEDIVELFYIVREHPSTPVTIQWEVELDADGEEVDECVVDECQPKLWEVGQKIDFGESVGPRVEAGPVGFVGDECAHDEDCGNFTGGERFFCHEAGFCTVRCEGYCTDRVGSPTTFCVEDPAAPGNGACLSKVDGRNAHCALVPGTAPQQAERFIGRSAAPSTVADVCLPTL